MMACYSKSENGNKGFGAEEKKWTFWRSKGRADHFIAPDEVSQWDRLNAKDAEASSSQLPKQWPKPRSLNFIINKLKLLEENATPVTREPFIS